MGKIEKKRMTQNIFLFFFILTRNIQSVPLCTIKICDIIFFTWKGIRIIWKSVIESFNLCAGCSWRHMVGR
jgi:hypothetical protein